MTGPAERDCPGEVLQNLVAYLDGELDGAARAAVEAHLAACEECRAELERFRRARSAVHRLAVEEPSTGLHGRIVERVRAKIQELEAGGSTRFFGASRRSRAETEAPFPGLAAWLRKHLSGPRTLILSLLIVLALAVPLAVFVIPELIGSDGETPVAPPDLRRMRLEARRALRRIEAGGADVSGFSKDGAARVWFETDPGSGEKLLIVYDGADWQRFLKLERMARAQGTGERWDAIRRGAVRAEVRGGRLALPGEIGSSAFGGDREVYVLRLRTSDGAEFRTELWAREAFEAYRRPAVELPRPE